MPRLVRLRRSLNLSIELDGSPKTFVILAPDHAVGQAC
ncbi:MAG: hypothetical protein JWN04_400 [Myxococcaceae bacterium]|nr:hypothetical protein [Myxococcaceae bacterium]